MLAVAVQVPAVLEAELEASARRASRNNAQTADARDLMLERA
jgi:hypothetical protein